MYPEANILLNYHVERTLVLNKTIQENKKVMEYQINETDKFNILKKNIEEAVSKFKSVAKTYQKYWWITEEGKPR